MSFFKKLFGKKEKQEKKDEPKQRSNLTPKSASQDKKVGPSSMHVKDAIVTSIIVPSEIVHGEILEIVVNGQLTDVGWKIKDAQAKIEKHEIFVNVQCYKKAGTIAATVMKPYSTTIKVERLGKGSYLIIVPNSKVKPINVMVK